MKIAICDDTKEHKDVALKNLMDIQMALSRLEERKGNIFTFNSKGIEEFVYIKDLKLPQLKQWGS
ncbi:MAG: hypothetical protein ATN35_07265 [Epulopiscium sp. Nele67-Bin004]|nr:MAG: hypothetical protein ATN35_07265 [Epulopiscium sp. Nele67-Bin004]